jgi:hypothetical protein
MMNFKKIPIKFSIDLTIIEKLIAQTNIQFMKSPMIPMRENFSFFCFDLYILIMNYNY